MKMKSPKSRQTKRQCTCAKYAWNCP